MIQPPASVMPFAYRLHRGVMAAGSTRVLPRWELHGKSLQGYPRPCGFALCTLLRFLREAVLGGRAGGGINGL